MRCPMCKNIMNIVGSCADGMILYLHCPICGYKKERRGDNK